MRKTTKLVTLLLAVMLMVGMFAGCGAKTEKPAEDPAAPATPVASEKAKILRISSAYDFKSATEGKTLVYECLVKTDMAGHVSPWLAESYDVSEDGMVITFHLRNGVTFHNGTSFSADTVKLSLDYACNSSVLGKYVDSVNIIDDSTVELKFATYLANALNMISGTSVPMLCAEDLDPVGDPTGKLVGFIGTGAFYFVEDTYEKNVKTELKRYEDYWDGVPAIEGVDFMNISDPNAMVVALESDEVDVIGITEHHSSIPYVQIAQLKSEGYTVETDETGRIQVMEYNCTKAPFDDANVRMAINLAFDRETMVATLFEGMTTASNVITAPWFVYGPNNVDQDYYKYNPEKSAELLDNAGWKDSDGDGIRDKDGKPFEIVLLVPNGEANADAVSVYLQAELLKVGVKMDVKTLESSAASELKDKGEYDMYVHHSFCQPDVPGGINIGGKYHSSNTSWACSFHSAELDAMIEAAFTDPDESSRAAKVDELWTYLHAQAPCMPLYSVLKLVAMNPRVSGYHCGNNMFDMSMIKDMNMDMSK